MKNLTPIDYLAFVLVIIGGLNWGLFGILNIDLVAMILGNMSMLARIVYVLVGLSALYIALNIGKLGRN